MPSSDKTTGPLPKADPKVDVAIDPEQDFWDQVAAHEVLSTEKIEDYHERMCTTSRLPLGALLIKKKFITIRQIMRLLTMQMDEPHMHIGDLAVREGHCTTAQIDVCLSIQQEAQPNPIDQMLRDPDLNQASMLKALTAYIHHLEQSLFLHKH
ncbi:MAG: hypothetical protein ACI8QC_001874 [Planctomycetota bacterium]|jgi:hypothetical protein